MSEKFDGVRAYWNGQSLNSRHSKEIFCPAWFTVDFPSNFGLDGELWLGRGSFELLNQLLNLKDEKHPSWKSISYMVFDLPNSKEPYETRIHDLANLTLPKHVQVAAIKKCKGGTHLQECLAEILEHGGEGLMMNKPHSLYVTQRTNSLLKVKVRGELKVD
jgi:DNA ligase-1